MIYLFLRQRAIIFLLFFFLFGIVSFGIFSHRNTGAEARMHILSGAGVTDIARMLGKEKVVRTPSLFISYAFMTGAAHRLKPGLYTFPKGLSIAEVTQRLIDGPPPSDFLIPEGRALRDIEIDLARLGVVKDHVFSEISPEEFSARYPFLKGKTSFEGFLFPDTYRIIPGTGAREIMAQMLDNFSKKAWPLISAKKNWYEILISASLLEREVKTFDDRTLVAGIFRKRLSIGMALQIDATVQYAACGKQYENCHPLTASDLLLSSPYNTYIRQGLPPTPIANPGIDALRAALAPRTSSYLYYISVPETGKTVFASDFEGHRLNKARYLHRSS